jgi:hypothetical protein
MESVEEKDPVFFPKNPIDSFIRFVDSWLTIPWGINPSWLLDNQRGKKHTLNLRVHEGLFLLREYCRFTKGTASGYLNRDSKIARLNQVGLHQEGILFFPFGVS